MDLKYLAEAITDGGISNTNFFNGRLLTAEDLRTEQTANRQQRQMLGRALGAGIIYGLEVKPTPGAPSPVSQVTVSAGLALNRRGQPLVLTADVNLALAPPVDTPMAQAGLFGDCEPPQPVVTGAGVYLLLLSPASALQGRALTNGLNINGSRNPDCGQRYAVEGVQFRLVRFDPATVPGVSPARQKQIHDLLAASTPADRSLLRNLLAHVCLATEQRLGFPRDPSAWAGGLDGPTPVVVNPLAAAGVVTACDVPLALLFWTTAGIQFVDLGSVRRRPLPGPPTQPWPLLPGGGYPALGEAVSVQFQEQLAQLTGLGLPANQFGTVQAINYFRYLPAAGLLPVGGAAPGFDYRQFFNTLPYRAPVFIEGATLEALVRTSLSYAPIDLANGELIWLYIIRENIQAIDQGPAAPPAPYVIFTSGDVPFQGNARFNLARWNYSNYL